MLWAAFLFEPNGSRFIFSARGGLRLVALSLLVGCAGLTAEGQSARAAQVSAQSPTNLPSFADLVAKVKPAVIAVTVKIESDARSNDTGESEAPSQSEPFGGNSPLHHYFFEGPEQRQTQPQPGPQMMALGSGFFISSDGYAVTNDHVVQNGVSFMIATEDGTTYPAKVVGADLRTDLALLKVDGRTDFPYVKLADHEPRIGDWVIAVGNPYGLGGTVTAGIVSARGRHIDTDTYDDFLQIDAPINKGNSGGPSFGLDGDVVGVNTAIFSPSGGSVGIGFAIPATTVAPVVRALKEKGVVTRGALGVQIQTITPDMADALGLKREQGALIAQTQADGAAAKSGIVPGDVIVTVDDRPVKSGADLAAMISALPPGATVKVGVLHDGSDRTISVTLGELPNTPFKAPAASAPKEPPGLGLALAPAANVQGAGNEGVVITDVDPNGAAAQKGLVAGDVITEAGNAPVSTPDDIHKAVRTAQEGGKRDVLLRVKKQDNRTQFVALPIAAEKSTLWGRIESWIHSL
ncbi:MAG: Do family serine endopeptidase [Hyphomicrobiales bacterium]|nr:Do family serine endopeptidase [Hyphomicrobiales bacterium]